MSTSESRRPSARQAIVVGAICFGLGSMVMVRADVLPPSQQFAIRDAFDEAFFARVTAEGALTVTDEEARLSLRDIVDRLTELNVSMPGGVAVNNLPAVQTVDGSVRVSNLPAIQQVVGAVDIGNAVQVYSSAAMPVVIVPISDVAPPFDVGLDAIRPGECRPFEVPAGHRLVTQTITALVISLGGSIVRIDARSGGVPLTYNIELETDRFYQNQQFQIGSHVGTHSVTLRFDPGIHKVCNFSQNANAQVTISGYLL